VRVSAANSITVFAGFASPPFAGTGFAAILGWPPGGAGAGWLPRTNRALRVSDAFAGPELLVRESDHSDPSALCIVIRTF
jgi:hypothetical protein